MLESDLAPFGTKKLLLAHTLAGNKVPYIRLPAKSTKKCPVIFITSRIHPGESGASWMLKGILD